MNRIREQVLNITLIAASIVGVILLISVAIRDLGEHRYLLVILQSFFLMCTIVITLLRHRISRSIKVYYVILNLWLTMLVGMYNLGFLASGKIIVVVAPMFVLFLLSFSRAIWSLVFFFGLYVFFGFLSVSGWSTVPISPDEYVVNYRSWITDGSLLLLGAAMLLFIGFHIQKEILSSLAEVKMKNDELQASRRELLENKENLERLVQEKTMKLVGAEKLASLGMLTAGIAHELNNPLNFISGAHHQMNLRVSKQSAEQLLNIDDLLTILGTGIQRVTTIVRGLNQFSRTTDSLDEQCDIHLILDNCLMMVNSQIKFRIEIHRDYDQSIPVIQGNSGKLHQVFLNILANAAQAIPDNGLISIQTQIRDDRHVLVAVQDTGTGILPENLSRVTDPFFTTKPTGQGTGLGLYITQSIMNEHNGSISFRPATDTGTIVEVILPLTR